MRWVALALALVMLPAQAQIPNILAFTPMGTVISATSYVTQDQKKVYYARVQSQGATFEQAQSQGLKLAVEQAIGPLVLSQSQSTNGRLKRDEIISYSSGMVDRFHIMERREVSQGTVLIMEVWVAHSNIANRLLNESTASGTVDGERLGARTESLLHEREQGDRVVSTVMLDFPQRAFDLRQAATRSTLDERRNAILMIPWTLEWNVAFLDSLWSAMRATSQTPQSRCLGIIRKECVGRTEQLWSFTMPPRTLAGDTGNLVGELFLMGMQSSDTVYFLDSVKNNIVERAILQARPVIKLSIANNSGVEVIVRCWSLPVHRAFIDNQRPRAKYMITDGSDLKVNSREFLRGEFHVDLGQNTAWISTLAAAQMHVISGEQCRDK